MHLDQELEQLNITNEGGTVVITVSPIKLTKIAGVKVLIEVGQVPRVKKILEAVQNQDAARMLGINLSRVDRLRAGLGLRIKYNKNSAVTQWRRRKEKDGNLQKRTR